MLWQLIKKCKYFVLLIVVFIGFSGVSETPAYKPLINKNLENEYLNSYNTKSFFEAKLSDAKIELDNIDLELINATLFFNINKKRGKGRKKEFRNSPELNNTCKSIVEKYSGSSLKRLRWKEHRIEKIVKKQSPQYNFNGSYTDVVVDFLPLLKIRDKQKYIYNNEQSDEDIFFFSKNKKSTLPYKPIPHHTYQSLIESILKRSGVMRGSSQIRNKGFSELGCYISIEQQTPKKIPYAKMVWIVGGYRLGLIEDL